MMELISEQMVNLRKKIEILERAKWNIVDMNILDI